MEPRKRGQQQCEPAQAEGRVKRRRAEEERQVVIGRKNAEVHKGVFDSEHGTYGFIEEGESRRVFVMPSSCREWDKLPPIGTVVTFNVVRDVRTNMDRADNVRSSPDEATAERWRAKKSQKAEKRQQQGAEEGSAQKKQESKQHGGKTAKQVKGQSFAESRPEKPAEHENQGKGSNASHSSSQAGGKEEKASAAVEISDEDEKAEQNVETWPMTMSVVEKVAERMELPAKMVEAVNKALDQAKEEFARSYQAWKDIERSEERAKAQEEVLEVGVTPLQRAD